MRVALLILLGACGDNRAAPAPVVDARCGDACPATCAVVLTGNVSEVTASEAACPVLMLGGPLLTDTVLAFMVPSPALATSFGIQIDLGAMPVAGMFSSESVVDWSAIAIESIAPSGACIFLAGASSVPTGYFTLELTSIDLSTAHGTLEMSLAVLPRTTDQGIQTDCGAGSTEVLDVTF